MAVFLIGVVSDYMICQENQENKGRDEASRIEKNLNGTQQISDALVIKTECDKWGYNYQDNIFIGNYCNAHRDSDLCKKYRDVVLMMQWNDALLSYKNFSSDGKIKSRLGIASYVGSGACLTNHMWGAYQDENGDECYWDYYVKIVAVPADAYKAEGIWYSADGREIGPVIWDEFAIVQQRVNGLPIKVLGNRYIKPIKPKIDYSELY